jgi:predicted nucleotidyltransferase
MIASLEEVLRLLQPHEVRYIVIGGWAAIIHGNARSTNDVDLVYARDHDNIRRLVEALRPWNPYLRGVPRGLPFRWDETTVRAGWNFTLTTDHGDIDLLGEATGAGTYERLLPYTEEVTAFGITCRVVTLERLIQIKRAAGWPKDLIVLAELQALLEERRQREASGASEPEAEARADDATAQKDTGDVNSRRRRG